MCHCGAVIKDKLGSTPCDAVSCFLVVPFFVVVVFVVLFVWSLFLTLFFLLACFPLFLLLTLLIMHFYHNIYFKLKSGVVFWKRYFKSS